MKIVFVTTQNLTGSTVRGRILPLIHELAKNTTQDIHLIIHGPTNLPETNITLHSSGLNPFVITPAGKKRLTGLPLIWHLLTNAIRAAYILINLKAETIIISKPLPENVLAVTLATWFYKPAKIVLDADDFELSANVLSSSLQRFAIHWAERQASKLSANIIVATPFLGDHLAALSSTKKPITLIPTGLTLTAQPTASSSGPRLVYTGSVSVASGHRVDLLPAILAEVIAKVPSSKLLIVGSGDDLDNLKQQFAAKNLSDKIIWQEFVPMDQFPNLISPQDIFIDPIDTSITNRAKSSFRVAAALALGLPVITSNIGIRTQLIPREFHQAFFAEAGSAPDYASKIITAMQNPISLADQQLLKTKSQEYSWEKLAAVYQTQL